MALKRPGPVGGKRDENRRARSRELQAAGLALFLEQGIDSTTIDAIVARADVAKGSFYRYFKDKDALVKALFTPVSMGLVEVFTRGHKALNAARTQEQLLDTYQQLAFSTAALLFAHKDEVLLYLQESRGAHVASLNALLRKWAYELTLAARQQGLLREMPPEITSLAVLGAAEALLLEYLRRGDAFGDSVVIAQTLIDMVLEGVRSR